MTDISSLQKFLTKQPDASAIRELDMQANLKDAEKKILSSDFIKQANASIKTRRNIKD
jgi:hypothetical protein